jgi:3-deoxy-D-manno-octulosonic-acid transferase
LRTIYTLLTYLLRPVALAAVVWRSVENPAYRVGMRERFGFGPRLPATEVLWVHAVSLGEVTAAAPLIRALRIQYPDMSLILTTATPTGRARAAALFGASVVVRFLPYDTPGSMRRFLARAHPRLAIVMETELWPNLFHRCRQLGIPVVLANARLSEKSVARYRRFGGLFRDVFAGDTVVAAQSAEDAERFIAIGAQRTRTHVVGNLKFDIEFDGGVLELGRKLRAAYWPDRPVWIAGSTHHGEEELALAAHSSVQAALPGALLLLVPRHPERFQAVADLLNRCGVRFERRSSDNAVRPDVQVLLVDTVGELASLYASVDVAFVGGSLVPVGGHNLLEPAALGVPVITGPYQANAREIAALLLREGAALQVGDSAGLALKVMELLSDGARRATVGGRGLHVVGVNRGSLRRLVELIEPLLAARRPGAPQPGAPRPGAADP